MFGFVFLEKCSLSGRISSHNHVAEIFDKMLDENSFKDSNVSKMLASGGEVECRPYRSRTCDTLIKRYRPIVPPSPSE